MWQGMATSSRAIVFAAATMAGASFGGCGSDADSASDIDDSHSRGSTDPNAPSPNGTSPQSTTCHATAAIHLASPVADARARKPLNIAIDLGDTGGMPGAHPLKVVLTKDGKAIKTLLDATREPGKVSVDLDPSITSALATGRYGLSASAGCPAGATESTPAEAAVPLFLVRLGVTSIDVQKGDGERVALMYHAVGHHYENVYPITEKVAATLAIAGGEPDIDDASGKLRVFAKPWSELDTPPTDADENVLERGVTWPVSLKVGTKPDIVLELGKTAAGATPGTTFGSGLDTPECPAVRIVVDGNSPSEPIVPGKSVTARLAQSPVASIARVDHALTWRFEAKGADGRWSEIPGADASATLRLYGVLGNAQGTAAPDLPWVAVVDDATHAIGGAASDAAGARALLVKHVYEEMGLSYDRAQGASHYTDYTNGGYTHATFLLARFLERELGTIVNCSDCASILSTYSNMIGAPLSYSIIGWSFSLHPIQGIGSTTFGSPFTSGRMGFTYHAVTSSDASATIHDATLAVDGDTTPAAAPFTKQLVHGMPGAEYLDRLSGDSRAGYIYVGKSTSLTF